MYLEPTIRQLLINSCHSSKEAEKYLIEESNNQEFIDLLLKIAIDADDYQGDAPMMAAYYLSQAKPSQLYRHETELLALLETADGYAGSVALALGKIQSLPAKSNIEQGVAEGWFPTHFYEEALSYYNKS